MSGQPDISQWNLQIRMSDEPSRKLLGPSHYPSLFNKDLASSRTEKGEDVRAIICFDCGQISFASDKAASAKCKYCGLEMMMSDMSLGTEKREDSIITQGSIAIEEGQCFSGKAIMCRNMAVDGWISGLIYCLGQLKINCSGVFADPVQAHSIFISPGAKVEFLATVRTKGVVIEGEVTGNIICEGTLVLGAGAILRGDVVAAKLEKSPKATHKGKYRELFLPDTY